MPSALLEPVQDILTTLTPCQELQEPPPHLAVPEPEQAAAPAMEVHEEPLRPRPMSEPTEDILTALTLCDVQEESPAPLRAREPEQAPAPAMEVLEEPVMAPAISEPRQDILTALTPCQELQEPPAPQAAPEPKQAAAAVIGVAEGRRQSPLTVEQPASAPEQQFLLPESPKDGFPSRHSSVSNFYVVHVPTSHLNIFCSINKG